VQVVSLENAEPKVKENTMETTKSNTTPLVPAIWNKETEASVKQYVAAGASVPKALMKSAPKGFVAGLRATRKAELVKDTSKLLGGFTDRGFKIEALSNIKTLKSGVQTVTMRLATPKPTSALTMAEFAASIGTTVEEIAETFKK
jgi:hypothetical protein